MGSRGGLDRTIPLQSAGFGSLLALLVFSLAAAWLVPPQAVASVPDSDCADSRVWTDIVGAERAYWEAIKVLEGGERGVEAAQLFEQSAALRVLCDPQVFSLLRLAALLYHRTGELERARRTMLRAADVGVRTRKILAAAHAYLDYSALSNELGDTKAAVDGARKAEALSHSPALSEWARSTILDRMDWRQADSRSNT